MFLLTAAGILLVYLFIKDRIINRKIYKFSEIVAGPKVWPLLGSSLEFLTDSVGIFKKMTGFSYMYDRYYQLWNNGKLFLIIKDCKDVETVMGDNVNITKSDLYKVIIPWIGYGLLTSTGKKWKIHRRLITPTFYFKILEDFMEIFNKNGKIMSEMLENELNQSEFNMFNYVNRAALDNICETAMGVTYDVQKTKDSSYLKAIKTICSIASLRQYKVWLMVDALFKLSPQARIQKEALDFVHEATFQLIREKRAALEKKKQNLEIINENDDDTFTKKKKAFLDLLLENAGTQLTDKDICDEVNTFMFEGHDTISSAISFAFYELARNPDVQEKLHNELLDVLGDDETINMQTVNELKYLEQIIKETLRLYPSVPLVGRELEQDLKLHDGVVVPKGTNLFVNFYNLHRDPKAWENPEQFNPDNFNLEKMKDRHPYAFVPFSAGSRNCIGQKFAMLEMKVTISYVIRKFKLSTSPNHELQLANELVLISKNGQVMKLQKR